MLNCGLHMQYMICFHFPKKTVLDIRNISFVRKIYLERHPWVGYYSSPARHAVISVVFLLLSFLYISQRGKKSNKIRSKFLPANLADKFWIQPTSGEFYPRLVGDKDLSLNFYLPTWQTGYRLYAPEPNFTRIWRFAGVFQPKIKRKNTCSPCNFLKAWPLLRKTFSVLKIFDILLLWYCITFAKNKQTCLQLSVSIVLELWIGYQLVWFLFKNFLFCARRKW